jgi:hypothetical protein
VAGSLRLARRLLHPVASTAAASSGTGFTQPDDFLIIGGIEGGRRLHPCGLTAACKDEQRHDRDIERA